MSTGIIALKQPSVQSDLTDGSQNRLTLEASILNTVVELRGPSFEATKWRRNRRTPKEDWTECLLWVSVFFWPTLWSQNLARFHMEILKYDMVYTYAYVYAFVYVYV